MEPCSKCETPEYCADIRRCLYKGIETESEEGDVVDDQDEIFLSSGLKRKKIEDVTVPEKLTTEHRDFLKNVLNF